MPEMENDRDVPFRTRALVAMFRGLGLLLAGIRRLRGRPLSILVERRARLGDLLVILPMLRALRERYPDATIVLGVHEGSPAEELLAGSPDLDAVRVIEPARAGGSRVAVLRDALRRLFEGYDVLISGEHFSMIDAAFYCGAPLRIGLDEGAPLQRLNHVRVPIDPTRHAVENHLALAERLGAMPADPIAPAQRIAPSLDHLAPSPGRLPEGLDTGAFVLIHCGAQKPSRRWPVERFGELATRLLDAHPKWRIAVTGVPQETALVDALCAAVPETLRARCLPLVGRTDLADLVTLVDCARVVVSNDTGVMHLTAARRAPLVALLGPENDAYWGPRPADPRSAIALRNVVPCAPCVRWDCGPHYCLRSLEVDVAVEAVEDLAQERVGAFGTRRRHLDWQALEERGFAPPSVALRPAEPSPVERSLDRAALARLRSVPPADARNGPADAGRPGARPYPRSVDEPADAELVVVGARPARAQAAGTAPADLGDAVAALQRDPDAQAALLSDGGALVRRAAFERAREAARHAALADTRERAPLESRRPGPVARLAALARDVWSYRDLLQQITLRDVRIRYKQAVMGFGWAVLMPMLIVGAGALVRYAMAQMSGSEMRGSAIVGMAVKALPWAFFVGAVGFATASLAGNLQLVTKVAFPRIVLPIASVLTQAFDTLVGAVALALLMPFLGLEVSGTWVWAPLLALLAFALTAAAAIFLSCANLFFRDVKYLVQVFLTFGIFFTPVFFEPEMFGRVGSVAIMLNPLSPVLEGLRLAVVEGHDLAHTLTVQGPGGAAVLAWTPWYLAYAGAVAVLGLGGSALLFRRLEPVFAEYA